MRLVTKGMNDQVDFPRDLILGRITDCSHLDEKSLRMLQSIADQSSIRDGGGSRQVEWGDDEEFEEDFDPNLPYPGYVAISFIITLGSLLYSFFRTVSLIFFISLTIFLFNFICFDVLGYFTRIA